MIRILKYGEVANSDIFARAVPAVNVEAIVSEIIANVKERKDAALFEYCQKFDKAALTSLQVSEQETEEAMATVSPELIEIMKKAAANIRRFHERQVRNSFMINNEDGIVVGQKIIPVDRAGLYVPGGTAAYPSTVLMDAIPAKIAGCREVVITTPPGADGKVNPAILAAARIAGVDRIFKVGGAQAIAALAYGTETVPKVDKIVGPGNAFVAEAKKQVFGVVSIDMIAGPSEILIVADGKTSPRFAAADLLSQAEHDKMASAVLVTDSMELAEAVQKELEIQIPLLARAEIARASIDHNGKIIVADTLDKAIEKCGTNMNAEAAAYVLERVNWRLRLAQYPEAIADYDLYYKLVNGQVAPDFYYLREQAKFRANDLDGALADIRSAIAASPQTPDYYAEEASVLVRQQKHEEALKSLDQALALAPDFGACYRLRGVCYVRLGKKAEACEAFNKAKELGDPLAERLIKEHCQ